MMRKSRVKSSVVVLGLLTAFVSARPAGAVSLSEWLPGLKADVFLTERLEYESNIFQTRRSSEDLVSRTSPGFIVDFSGVTTTLSAGYRAELLHFFRHNDQDDTHHIAFGSLAVNLPKLSVRAREDYVKTSDPPNTELTGRIESTTNTFAPEVEYRLTDRLSVATNFAWTKVDFPKLKELSRDEYLYGGTVFWRFADKAQLGLLYNHGEKNFTHLNTVAVNGINANRDVTRDLIAFRLRGDLTSKLSAGFNAGYEIRSAQAANGKDAHGIVFGGNFTYRPTDRTTFSLLANRSYEESTFAVTSPNGLFFTSTSLTLLAEQQFTTKLRGNIRVTGVENDYPVKQADPPVHPGFSFREDNLWGWGGGLNYNIQRWLIVGADYSHSTRDSNFKEFKYQDDKISGSVTLRF